MKTDIFNPVRKYKIIYADPPWSYNDRKCNGGAEKHYSVMNISDIKALPVKEIAADDCILFLWATYPMLKEMFEVMEAWGFQYKTIGFQWVKQNKNNRSFFFGLGRYTRGNTEACFIGVKGKPKIIDNSISQLIVSPVQRHSRKPPVVREKIVQLCGNVSRIELFAREEVKGWHCWGNEV